MKRIKMNTFLPALLALSLLALAAGCSAATSSPQDGDGGPEPPYTGNYAGRVEGTEAFVAVVVDKQNHALAYLCDGRDGESATLAEWFTGAVADDGTLDLRSEGGAHLVANVAGEGGGAEGSVTLPDGEEHAFVASPVEAPAGLYRKEASVDGEGYVGGWIELEGGEERGAVKNTSSGVIGQDITFGRPSEPVDGFTGQNVDI